MSETVPPTKAADPRDKPSKSPNDLKRWIRKYTGIKISDKAVCEDHQSPWECFRAIHLDRPSIALVLGSRGSGKSFLSALDTHLTSRWDPGHGTRILGGSKAQSAQIYGALRLIVGSCRGKADDDAASIAKLRKDGALYRNGSEVEILAASQTSVRGPHVPSLKLDEVDEMDTEIRESAMGMCLGRKGKGGRKRGKHSASVIMTSTCHRSHGPMAELIERANAGEYPLYTMCAFEVLERCPKWRSGPRSADGAIYEKCPECPIFRYCCDVPDGVEPKAKRSDGHYPIDSLIQKLKTTSVRTFEADYLCKMSSSEAAWFPDFQPETHVTDRAEFVRGNDVHLAIDTGVFTGAVFFQVIEVGTVAGVRDEVRVFADYLAEGVGASRNARRLGELAALRCPGPIRYATTDPAGKARTAIGPTVLGEYSGAGLSLVPWPLGKVADGLALLDSFISPAENVPRLLVHPRCEALIAALRSYRRAKRAGQWLDRPEDPQHPHEDLVDALRGGLKARYPRGRHQKPSNMQRAHGHRIF